MQGVCFSHVDKAICYVLLFEVRKQEMYLMSICIKMVSVIRSIWLSDTSCPHRQVVPALVSVQTFSSFPGVHKTILVVGNKLEVYKVLMAELGLKHQLFRGLP